MKKILLVVMIFITVLSAVACQRTHTHTVTGELIIEKEATCNEDGWGYTFCSKCGEMQEIVDIPKTNEHNIVTIPAIEPTCSNYGVTEGKKCCECGEVTVEQQRAPKKAHTLTILPAVEATCTKTGLSEGRQCTVCGEIIVAQQEIPKAAHREVYLMGTEATCSKPGLTEGKKCSACSEILIAQQEIPVIAHTYTDKYDETCNKCGYVRPDAECAHEEKETIKGCDSTCTSTGLTDGEKCKKCGEILVSQTVISAKGHNEVTDEAVEATCTSTGLTEGKHCGVCNMVLIAQEVISIKPHTEVIDEAVEPTCTTIGLTEGKHCEGCNTILVEQNVIPANGHTEIIDESIEATCTTIGLTEGKHCGVCGTVLVAQQEISLKEHIYDDNEDRICNACGFQRCIHRLDYEKKKVPSSTEGFYKYIDVYTCVYCYTEFEPYDVVRVTVLDSDEEGYYTLEISSKMGEASFNASVLSNEKIDIVVKSESFSYITKWTEKKEYINTVIFGDNIYCIEDASSSLYYVNTFIFGSDVEQIAALALERESLLKSIYFEGDLPELARNALYVRGTHPTVYYYEGAKGFEEYGYKIQWCALKKMGEELTIPQMSLKEYSQKATQKSVEMAMDFFERGAINRPYLQFIPICNINEYKEIKDFTLSLTSGLSTDKEKAKAIFDWIVENIEYALDAWAYSVSKTFKEKKAVCAGYVALMHDMLAAVEIPSQYVSGISYLGSGYTVERILNGEAKNDRSYNHAWLICCLDGEAVICDPTWANFDISADEISIDRCPISIYGINVVPDEINPFLYKRILYYDGNRAFGIVDGTVGEIGNGTFNFIVELRYQYTDPYDDYLDCPIGDTCRDVIYYYEGGATYYCGSDYRSYEYYDVVQFVAFEKIYYDNSIDLEGIDEFCFDDHGGIYHIEDDGTLYFYRTVSGSDVIEIEKYVDGKKVLAIETRAFAYNSKIKKIIISDSIVSIGESAFFFCTSLTNIVIPNSVTNILEYAFRKCSSLVSITIPDSVVSLDSSALLDCSSLSNIEVHENNEYYKSIDGNLYSKDGKTLIQYAIGKKESTFIVPDFVTSVGVYAFENCHSLVNVVIPDSVTSIEGHAFYDCGNLKTIIIPNTVISIGGYAFRYCHALEIYCEAESQPDGWESGWNPENRPVVWGYTGE